jgi:hypothetical protein
VPWEASIFYPRPNFKAYYLRRTFSRLSRECDADDKLCIKEFWRQCNIKMAIVILFPFYAFSIHAAICRNANPVYKESHLYMGMVQDSISSSRWVERKRGRGGGTAPNCHPLSGRSTSFILVLEIAGACVVSPVYGFDLMVSIWLLFGIVYKCL